MKTSYGQSIILRDNGMGTDTADCCYVGDEWKPIPYRECKDATMPSWSSDALVGLLPDRIEKNGVEYILRVFLDSEREWRIGYLGKDGWGHFCSDKSLVDAAWKMLMTL